MSETSAVRKTPAAAGLGLRNGRQPGACRCAQAKACATLQAKACATLEVELPAK